MLTVTYTDKLYPARLRQIHSPPKLLYYRGVLRHDLLPLAIVGSRTMSAYGERALEHIISGLSTLPIVIISGLAFGTDARAHALALEHKIVTWAVLGSGADSASVYPRHNRAVAEQIVANGGALISEFPPGTKPRKMFFPKRNRIIAGLSEAVLVTEAAPGSGALITAGFARDENRDLLAVPGQIFDELSTGPNRLIADGAVPVMSAADIVTRYRQLQGTALAATHGKNSQTPLPFLSEQQQTIMRILRTKPCSAEELAFLSKLQFQTVLAELTALEMRGVVRSSGLNFFVAVDNAA